MFSKLFGAILLISSLIGLSTAINCVQCDSATDANCVVSSDQITATPCDVNNNSTCFSRIVDGRTVRGCLGSIGDAVTNCTSDNLCETCIPTNHGNACNNAVYPSHRFSCHQCNGNISTPCGPAQTGVNAVYCKIFSANETCYIRRDSNMMIHRGCFSDQNECGVSGKCYTCLASGCNNMAFNSTEVPMFKDSASMQCSSLFLSICLILFVRFNNIFQ